jgi:glycosyltransferase involved in cell wall biosynthesis
MGNKTFIYFGNDWFAENKTSSHHIADRLAKQHNLLYVECPGLRMPQGNKRDIGKLFAKVRKSISMPRKLREHFWVYTLFQIPLHRYNFIRKLNEKIILYSLKRVILKLGLSDPILWFHIPHLSMVPGKLEAKGVVYYCIDSYSSLPNVDKAAVQAMDEEMTRAADIVFVSSAPLYERKKGIAKELVLSPHGVDFEHFSSACSDNLPFPQAFDPMNKPVIGFWGLIENRIDLDLIRFLAIKNPTWNILMIGHVAVQDNPCSELRNVIFVGPRKYSDLPSFAKLFDVAILPYKNNEFVFHCNPIKLREYLATGKPVVSTYYPEIDKYRDIVSIADSYEEFSEKIDWHLKNDTQEKACLRMGRVKAESWEKRLEEISGILNKKFNGQKKQ